MSGKGGNGCMSFRREAFVPKGGPDGGDGGRGGDVVARADSSLHTLLDCQYQQLYRARNGAPGSGSNKTGRSAEKLVISVPVGTQIFDHTTGDLVADLDKNGMEVTLAPGGKGGRGNAHFATSRNRAPRRFDVGQPGVERVLMLELKLMADVGLIGFPNAGKSTLISKVSNARPKIADYPFTTKVPALGVVRHSGVDFMVADIPGLIEGAHLGAGMGDRFLRHIERTQILVHLIDPSPILEPDAETRFNAILHELKQYADELTSRPMIVAITKMDLPENEEPAKKLSSALAKRNFPVYKISAITGQGVKQLLTRVAKTLTSVRSTHDNSSSS